MQKTRALFIIVALSFALVGWSTPAMAENPKGTLKRLQSKINKLLRQKVKVGTAKEKRIKEQLQTTIRSMLDFDELARRSLRKHWDARTVSERTEFTNLLKDLIERNYISQLKTNLDYKLAYGLSSTRGDKAKVLTTVTVEKNRRVSEISIEYKMRKVKNSWMVYDVITDGVSIVRNYRSQFNRIIRKKSYQALVDKMRKKLKQMHNRASSGTSNAAKSSS